MNPIEVQNYFYPDHIILSLQHGESIMLWKCFSWPQTGKMVRVDGKVHWDWKREICYRVQKAWNGEIQQDKGLKPQELQQAENM